MASICLRVERGVVFQTTPWILHARCHAGFFGPTLKILRKSLLLGNPPFIVFIISYRCGSNSIQFLQIWKWFDSQSFTTCRGPKHVQSRSFWLSMRCTRIDIMRSLRHPHIVELHFSFQDESHVYLGRWVAHSALSSVLQFSSPLKHKPQPFRVDAAQIDFVCCFFASHRNGVCRGRWYVWPPQQATLQDAVSCGLMMLLAIVVGFGTVRGI